MENRLSKVLFFKSFPKKNAEVVNLKNLDLDLIPSILLECGYFGYMIRFFISPKKKPQNPFLDSRKLLRIFPKNAPCISCAKSLIKQTINDSCSERLMSLIRELTKRGRRRLRGLHLKIQVRVIHITTKLFHVVLR